MDKPIDNWKVQQIKLWYLPEHTYTTETNIGFDQALELLHSANERHPDMVTLIDVSSLSKEELIDVYLYHAVTCSWWKYEVRRVFGSNSTPGWLLGVHVPLLSLRFQEFEVPMVAPYNDWQTQSKQTILNVLSMLSSSEQLRLFGRTI